MPLPGKTDLERAINEFMEINSSLDMPKDQRKFEGGVLAQVIADKLNDLFWEKGPPPKNMEEWGIVQCHLTMMESAPLRLR